MPTPSPGPLVLIVDDNARNLKLAGDVLVAAGFRTLTATTGKEGVAFADEHLPDVVLMDLRLPDMDGTDAARLLAQQARTALIPVVALTAVTLEDDPVWLRTAGFAGCLEKPIDVERFPDQVRRYCRSRSSHLAADILLDSEELPLVMDSLQALDSAVDELDS